MKSYTLLIGTISFLALQNFPSYSMTEEPREFEKARGSLRVHPPSPWQMANFYADYLSDKEESGASSLTFTQYLALTHKGRSCLGHMKPEAAPSKGTSSTAPAPSRVSVPNKALVGKLNVMVLLVDFPDLTGTQPPKYYERMLFSKGILQTGSMSEYYEEVSGGKLEVSGTVNGWLRMPQPYTFYTNQESGMEWDSYPRNTPRMAEDAVNTALQQGVRFSPDLDVLKNGNITALFLIHAGRGAEELPKKEGIKNIWSHKWALRNPVSVGNNLIASTYLTVPNDCKVGVCAHELGHLGMGWSDFYDPNYAEDGKYWDGAGKWDLMAGGSYGGGGVRPVHPVGLHKFQHSWLKADTVNVSNLTTSQKFTLSPFSSPDYSALRLTSTAFTPTQCLFLECRMRKGFDSELPGEGLLVWRVDTSQEQTSPDRPALLLIQADGQHQLENGYDNNSGDGGDPFPGTKNITQLLDKGNISTSFPNKSSGILITDIAHDRLTGKVTFVVSKASSALPSRAEEEPSDEDRKKRKKKKKEK